MVDVADDGQECADDDDDEGFVEGSVEPEHERDGMQTKGKRREGGLCSREPGPWGQQAPKEGLPPQTVVTRVIRELEDDFTHYKRLSWRPS